MQRSLIFKVRDLNILSYPSMSKSNSDACLLTFETLYRTTWHKRINRFLLLTKKHDTKPAFGAQKDKNFVKFKT